MTIIADATTFADDALDGFAALYPGYVRRVRGGVVSRSGVASGQVAVLTGGGAGHYPAFAGLVGPGMAGGAVCGNVFTSPSAHQVMSVARAAEQGGGVLLVFGNYAGDVLHFGAAQEQLRASGVDCRTVLVTDDIASAPPAETGLRRGIAGLIPVIKIGAGAADAGADLDTVEALTRHANARTRTLGLAFGGCTLPGGAAPLFLVDTGLMSVGLGIHGEPGIADLPRADIDGIADLLVERVLAEAPDRAGARVAVVLNGLGRIPGEELFVLYRRVADHLGEAGLEIVAPRCGNLVTSLDMAGVSLTLCWLDDELETWWVRAARSPAADFDPPGAGPGPAPRMTDPVPPAPPTLDESPALIAAAPGLVQLIRAALRAVEDAEAELGRIDAVAGDGDHGRGMVRGLRAALDAAAAAVADGRGAAGVLRDAGAAWSDRAGGTSGALWGTALSSAASSLAEAVTVDAASVDRAVSAAVDAVARVGRARPGDKTMLDTLGPFAETLDREIAAGRTLVDASRIAARAAEDAARRTAELIPRIGRARPLAGRSLGTVDPGAWSAALIALAVTASPTEGGDGP